MGGKKKRVDGDFWWSSASVQQPQLHQFKVESLMCFTWEWPDQCSFTCFSRINNTTREQIRGGFVLFGLVSVLFFFLLPLSHLLSFDNHPQLSSLQWIICSLFNWLVLPSSPWVTVYSCLSLFIFIHFKFLPKCLICFLTKQNHHHVWCGTYVFNTLQWRKKKKLENQSLFTN